MLHGKKGFERIMFAAKNVLNRPLVWLFQDLESEKCKICPDILGCRTQD